MRLLAIAPFLALCGAAQELPPEVLLLAHARTHMAEQLQHLPNYTCLESIARYHGEPRAKPKPLDLVRLEIVYSDGKEWFAAPGEGSFDSSDPGRFVASGLIGNGTFALGLHNLFASDAATIHYAGEESRAGVRAARYDFRFARELKPMEITVDQYKGAVGEAGSFWVDPKTLDLVAIESHAEEIPVYMPVAEAITRVTYARTRIGEYQALLPQQADLEMLKLDGALSFDRSDFTHCRAYQAQSLVHYGEVTDAGPGESAASKLPRAAAGAVPPFLPVTIELATTVRDRDAVGSPIAGRVAAAVIHGGKLVLPRGAIVRGRIRRLERYDDRTYAVGLEFTEVEANGLSLRFYADLISLDTIRPVRLSLSEKLAIREGTNTYTVTLPPLPGVAAFFVSGKSFTLPEGFRMTWRTTGLLRQ